MYSSLNRSTRPWFEGAQTGGVPQCTCRWEGVEEWQGLAGSTLYPAPSHMPEGIARWGVGLSGSGAMVCMGGDEYSNGRDAR